MTFKDHLHIVGLGLIGGSVAHGLAGSECRITGWDKNSDRLESALEQEIIESAFPPGELTESVTGVLLAVPVPAMVDVVKAVAGTEVTPKYVTDVGSTKNWICRRAREILPGDTEFIGAHPMAGSEQSGLEAADPLLFENAICVLTPADGETGSLSRIRELWRRLGAHLMEMSPAKHDGVTARISHLPHVLAAAMLHSVQAVSGYREDALPLAAGGFRDTTRIADSDPQLWRDILETNREEVLSSLEGFRSILEKVETFLETENWNELTSWLEQARETRKSIPRKAKGLLGKLYELRIQAPDEPGILAKVTGVLGEAGINICDIEVLRVREGEKGTIKLAFRERNEFEDARELLNKRVEGISII